LRYKVDLKRFMAECEANYFRLKRLFPGMEKEDSRYLGISGFDDHHLRIRVCERSPYTSLVCLAMAGNAPSPWIVWPTIRVRLYHDARLAEVVTFDSRRKVMPRNRYPNRHMFHHDEKYQWNRFLGEWLSFCQKRGYSLPDQLEVISS